MVDDHDIVVECETLDDRGLCGEAVLRLSEAIESSPSARLFFERGLRQERLGNHQLAREDYSQAVILAPEVMEYWLSRGRLLCDRLNLANEALADFQKAANLNPRSAVPLQYLSLCHSVCGNLDVAFECANRAVALDPEDALSHYFLGRCYLDAGSFSLAAREFEIALHYDRNSALCWSGLGRAQAEIGDLGEAEESYKNAVSIAPSASLCLELACVQLDGGHADRAIATLNMAQRFNLNEVERTLVEGYLSVARKNR